MSESHTETSSRPCPKCQKPLEEGIRFCPHCGAPLTDTSALRAGTSVRTWSMEMSCVSGVRRPSDCGA